MPQHVGVRHFVRGGQGGSEADGERCDTPQRRTPRHPRHRQPAAIPASRGVIF
ncbi:MAG: hypothetical protein L6V92_02635 [Phocaeicola vulgatus]|nr:MAG: hypothetical protein L6V92_02635 [Phocaeicola vulgatus]